MNSVAAGLGALGGVVVFISGLAAVIRGIFKMVGATEKNTTAVLELTRKIDSLDGMITNHEHRITVLEGKVP
jgi:hypothetical protein